MLILPQSMALGAKNPRWSTITPNQLFKSDLTYATKMLQWTTANNLPPPKNFFEVRIVKQQSILDLHQSNRWWDDPLFMDKVFWVIQKPLSFKMGFATFQAYALEYFECLRIVDIAKAKFGKNPFGHPEPSLCIPCDVVELAWDETTNGYSDHLRPVAENIKSQQRVDKDSTEREEIDKILATIEDVSNDVAWQGNRNDNKGSFH